MGEDLRPRSYQIELVDAALKQNSIIFLPTGSGKTFIAAMLIKELARNYLDRKLDEGGKRTFFLVNTVQLVSQQGLSVERQTPFTIGRYSGDMNVDNWTKTTWCKEFADKEVLVMTAQIFLNLILHGFITFADVNLLILDECHHARSNHGMAQIMNLMKDFSGTKPHVIGLTATLINSNVKPHQIDTEISTLQAILTAKVIMPTDDALVKKFSTNPHEKIVKYNLTEMPPTISFIIRSTLRRLQEIVDSIELPDRNSMPIEIVENARLMNKKKSWPRAVTNMIKQIEMIGDTLGAYAANKGILALIVRFERMKLHAEDVIVIKMLNALTTNLHCLRARIENNMLDCDKGHRPVQYASEKLRKLYAILGAMQAHDSTLVFVELRFTAKVLFYCAEDLMKNNERFAHIKPDYIVGYNNNPMNDVREMMFEKKVSSTTMERFNSKVSNVLFASSVIEEGTDISHCNHVIKFDKNKSFRSYIQSKGRARHVDSVYCIFAEVNSKALDDYATHRSIEREMTRILQSSVVGDKMHDKSWSSDPIPPFAPFGPAGPKVTVYSAISLINRYTSMLPQDKFANLVTFWWSRKHVLNAKVCAILQLPSNSAIKEPVEGPFCNNEADAKRASALVACEMLFNVGELDDQLLPCGNICSALEDPEIFSHWPDGKDNHGPKTGTTKCLRLYTISCPRAVFACQPKSGIPLYLHVLSTTPLIETAGRHRLETFNTHLCSNMEFAMLSSKPLPQLCDFTLFMNVGEININVFTTESKVVLSKEELRTAFDFHTLLFTKVLTVGNKFLVRDFENLENSYWIVPVLKDGKTVKIDWNTMRTHKSIPSIVPVPAEKRASSHIVGSDYVGKVVVPWYRPSGVPNTRYIVTNVREDLSPFSQFPSEHFETYADYCKERYGAQVMNPNQPLIEVRAISSKTNCLRPRQYNLDSKKYRQEDGFEETLIPELCILLELPAPYILKATALPSILHRVHHLLTAEELRQKIVTEAGLGQMAPPGGKWKKLTVDSSALQEEEEDPATNKSTIEVSDLLTENMEALKPGDPWKHTDEPKDIEKILNSVDLLSIIHYNKFVTGPKTNSGVDLDAFEKLQVDSNRANRMETANEVPSLNILSVEMKGSPGPQLADILQVITSCRASDIVNYERLETLGDSFLKFAVSLSLYENYSDMDEGKLTQLKGKIIGNRNLFYCGREFGICERLKAREFNADEWNVPSFTVVRVFKELLINNKLSPHKFYGIALDDEEIQSGMLSEESIVEAQSILNSLLKSEEEKPNYYSLLQLALQPVSDKYVADSVEALLGCYLQSCGIRGAFHLSSYLEILPKKLCDVTKLLDEPPITAMRKEGVPVPDLLKFKVIEEKLGYTFKDRSFLLQAFTHSSASHFATDCYQRLEFLGDAILDFLITIYIYDNCGNLSPGELTDLRSALVNNITFSCLAVKYDLHRHLISRTYSLTEAITEFAERQAKRDHAIGPEVSFLIEESEAKLAESVEVPKVLGDLFESAIAAIYLDSGRCLKTTWSVAYKMMYSVIRDFSQNVPKNNVRLLYEKFPKPKPRFGKSCVIDDGRVLIPVEIICNGPVDYQRKVFTGMGLTKAAAKLAAAKHALRYFHQKADC